MKKIHLLFIGFISLTLVLSSTAQNNVNGFFIGKASDIEELKHRKIIVQIQTPSEMELKKLSGKDDLLQAYKKAIENYNSNMKAAMEKFWKYTDSIMYKTEEEINKLQANKNDCQKYAVIYCYSEQSINHNLEWELDLLKKNTFYGTTSYLTIRLLDKWGYTDNPVYRICYKGALCPSRIDITWAIAAITPYFNTRSTGKSYREELTEIKESEKLLVKKTLLIPMDYTDGFGNSSEFKNGLTDNEVKAVYPYPYKLVSEDEMYKHIISADPAYAYVINTYFIDLGYISRCVVNCEDGATIAFSNGKPEIDQGALKDFCKNIK